MPTEISGILKEYFDAPTEDMMRNVLIQHQALLTSDDAIANAAVIVQRLLASPDFMGGASSLRPTYSLRLQLLRDAQVMPLDRALAKYHEGEEAAVRQRASSWKAMWE